MKRMYLRWCGVGVCVVLLGVTTWAWAADENPGTEEPAVVETQDYEPAPTYQNTAQATHDANVAEAYFERTDAEMAALQEDREDAVAQYGEESQEVKDIDAAMANLAEQRIGVEEGKIAEMRADGMGWGEIAHELGVHPGVLGLGHTKKTALGAEVAMATATDLKTGNSVGHGKAYDGGSGAKNGNTNNGHGGGKENNGHNGGSHGNGQGSNNGHGNANGKNK